MKKRRERAYQPRVGRGASLVQKRRGRERGRGRTAAAPAAGGFSFGSGRIAGDSPTCRDLVLQAGALPPLLQQLQDHSKLSMLRNATSALSNFSRGQPQPRQRVLPRRAVARSLGGEVG